MGIRKVLCGIFAAACVVVLATAPRPAAAQEKVDPEKLALARKYVNTVSMERLLKEMVPGMSRQMARSFMQRQPNADPKVINALALDIAGRFSEKFKVIVPQIAQLTAEEFSTGELRAVIAFYESPPGRSILAKLPKLNEQTMKLVVPWVQNVMPGIVIESIAALEKKGMKVR